MKIHSTKSSFSASLAGSPLAQPEYLSACSSVRIVLTMAAWSSENSLAAVRPAGAMSPAVDSAFGEARRDSASRSGGTS